MDVKGAREAAGLTQADLAARTGIDRTLISKWESSDRVPTSGQELLVAAALGLPVVRDFSGLPSNPHPEGPEYYPGAPRGGRPGSREAAERLAWFQTRNASAFGGVDRELPERALATYKDA